MTIAGWVTLIIIIGIVWGGLAFILTLALRKERNKTGKETEIFPTP